MPDVVMPRLSETMEEGTVIKWLKEPGDDVRLGEPLVEIETDKANMTYEAELSGTLEILVQDGETLPVGTPIARLGGGGDPATPGGTTGTVPVPVDARPAAPAGPGVGAAVPGNRERVKASPVARRLAADLGVDLATVAGSGPGGRIVKADVERAAGAVDDADHAVPSRVDQVAPSEPVATGTHAPGEGSPQRGETTVVELTRVQRVIARRMSESKATIPDYTVTTEVDMDAAVALRDAMKAAAETRRVPSFNDMVVKAAALALREFPKVNGGYRNDRWELHSRVNVGIAVATDDALIVPTVFDADAKSLAEVSRDAAGLAQRVRSGEITPSELSGGTFTVSNLGMFGVSEFSAIVTDGQAGILSVGALRDVPVVRDRQVVPGRSMTISLAADHRILNGAEAARFVARVRELLEKPVVLTF